MAKSRNIGIDQSRSEWISFLDSDDIWWQDRLKVLFDFIKKYNNKLRFQNLTFAPIEKDLINFKLLNQREKKYLSEYSKKIYFTLSPYLNKYEKNWLRSSIY